MNNKEKNKIFRILATSYLGQSLLDIIKDEDNQPTISTITKSEISQYNKGDLDYIEDLNKNIQLVSAEIYNDACEVYKDDIILLRDSFISYSKSSGDKDESL